MGSFISDGWRQQWVDLCAAEMGCRRFEKYELVLVTKYLE